MELRAVDGMPDEQWNSLVRQFDSGLLYHQAAWLKYLEDGGHGRVVRMEMLENGLTVGYFAGLLVNKGPFRILGSPVSGSKSEFMGPITNQNLDLGSFLDAIDGFCRQRRIHHLELGSPLFEPEIMTRHGFKTWDWKTFRIPLSVDRETMWTAINKKCRNRIRKGISNGLCVKETREPSFIETHHAQLREVFGRQGLAPSFSLKDLNSLVERLWPDDLVYTLQVIHKPSSEVVATGIFPHDDRHVYSISTASQLSARSLYPNELLYWTVMEMAGRSGIRQLSIGDNYRIPKSGGKFKDKFNGDYVPVQRYLRYYSNSARYAREGYRILMRLRQRLAGIVPGRTAGR
jgi:hypothetical protein